MSCLCRTTPDGNTIICDACASAMVQAITQLLPGDQEAVNLVEVMTPGEYRGMIGIVDGWLAKILPESQKEARS